LPDVETQIRALHDEATDLRDWRSMSIRAAMKLKTMTALRMRGRPLADDGSAAEIAEQLEGDAVKELQIEKSCLGVGVHWGEMWMWHPLPQELLRSVVRSVEERRILNPWAVFASLYPASALPRLARRLFAIPASEAEAERTIKIVQAVLGRFSGQMSAKVLIARVRIAMDCYQERQQQRRSGPPIVVRRWRDIRVFLHSSRIGSGRVLEIPVESLAGSGGAASDSESE
jgi:hypothetical protein